MIQTMFEEELQLAIDAVRGACALCSQVQRTLVSEETIQKKDRSPVTVADYGSQAVINAALMAATPNIPIVAEEDAHVLRDPVNAELLARVTGYAREVIRDFSESDLLDAIDAGDHDGSADRFWTLDPIDGTKGFIRGDQYAIALALVVEGRVHAGVLGCPNLAAKVGENARGSGVMLAGMKGEQAFSLPITSSERTSIHVSSVAHPKEMVFCESVESAHTSHGRSARVADILGVTNEPVRIDSQCKYGIVARGDASAYLRLPSGKSTGYQHRIWDHAAGVIVVESAGGRVTDLDGSDLDFSRGRTLAANQGMVVTNGLIHDQVVEAVQAVME